MNSSLQNELLKRYPNIFIDERGPVPVETGDGWYALIDTVCSLFESHVKAVEVKEKFGELVFSASWTTDFDDGLIACAEALSSRLCEQCGAPGYSVPGGWQKTACVDHGGVPDHRTAVALTQQRIDRAVEKSFAECQEAKDAEQQLANASLFDQAIAERPEYGHLLVCLQMLLYGHSYRIQALKIKGVLVEEGALKISYEVPEGETEEIKEFLRGAVALIEAMAKAITS